MWNDVLENSQRDPTCINIQKQVHVANYCLSLCLNISRLRWCCLVPVTGDLLPDQVVFKEVVGFIRGPVDSCLFIFMSCVTCALCNNLELFFCKQRWDLGSKFEGFIVDRGACLSSCPPQLMRWNLGEFKPHHARSQGHRKSWFTFKFLFTIMF